MNIRFYTDPKTKCPHIYEHGVYENEVEDILISPGEDRPGRDGSRIAVGQTKDGRYLQTQTRQMMKQNDFPHGWDEERVRRIIHHYESQTEEEAADEDAALFKDENCAVMKIPEELIPAVRALIANHCNKAAPARG
jgi:hypothetical protein